MRISYFSFAIVTLAVALGGCSGKTTDGSPDAGPIGSGCGVDTSIFCGGGYVGVSCLAGASPESDDAGVTCGGAAEAGAGTDYCCLSTTPPGLGCSVDSAVSCTTSGQVGYQCVGGTSPIGSDSNFQCIYQSSDPAGTTYTYCCSG